MPLAAARAALEAKVFNADRLGISLFIFGNIVVDRGLSQRGGDRR